jgi:hypothetical protein
MQEEGFSVAQVPVCRPLWMALLGEITKRPTMLGEKTVPEAADAWHSWGVRQGLVEERKVSALHRRLR